MAAAALPQSVQQTPRFGTPEARLSLLDRSDVLIVTPASTSATRLLVERARCPGVPIIAESISYPGAIVVVAIDDYRAGPAPDWVGTYAERHMTDEVRSLGSDDHAAEHGRGQSWVRRRAASGAPERADPVERGMGAGCGIKPARW